MHTPSLTTTAISLPLTQETTPTLQAVLNAGHRRAFEAGLDYAGLLYPEEAWALVREHAALLVDVRTAEELKFVSKVWKEPAFFLTHPLAIAAFGRECTRRGVPPPTVSLFGSQFLTWRGLPLIPSDKVPIDEEGKTKILLLRVGQERQGVIGLYQPGVAGEQSPGLSVRFMGINRNAIASYLISLYCSLAVLTEDALAVLDDVEVGKYHDYPDTYK